MLTGKHPAGAAETGLNLVGHQENAVAPAQLLDHAEKFGRRDNVPPFALDRLDEYGRNLFRRYLTAEQNFFDGLHAFDAAGAVSQIVGAAVTIAIRSEEHTSELQSQSNLVC